MNFIKSHKYTIILLIVLGILGLVGYKAKDLLFPNENKELYGTRLSSIDKYPLSETLYTDIEEALKQDKNYVSYTHRIQGKIINFTIVVSDTTSIADAKKVGETVISKFTEENLSYYTIQIIVTKKDIEVNNNFPIIATKNPKSEKGLVWTKDREITKEEEPDEKE